MSLKDDIRDAKLDLCDAPDCCICWPTRRVIAAAEEAEAMKNPCVWTEEEQGFHEPSGIFSTSCGETVCNTSEDFDEGHCAEWNRYCLRCGHPITFKFVPPYAGDEEEVHDA